MLASTVFNHIAKWSTVPIQGGLAGRDCFTFAMSWVRDAGGPDLTGWQYASYRDVRRLLKQHGFRTLPDYVDTQLKVTTEPKDGDVILVKSKDRFPAFGLYFDGMAWAASGKDGKIRGIKTPILRAWSWA